jgi:hypothetical protein
MSRSRGFIRFSLASALCRDRPVPGIPVDACYAQKDWRRCPLDPSPGRSCPTTRGNTDLIRTTMHSFASPSRRNRSAAFVVAVFCRRAGADGVLAIAEATASVLPALTGQRDAMASAPSGTRAPPPPKSTSTSRRKSAANSAPGKSATRRCVIPYVDPQRNVSLICGTGKIAAAIARVFLTMPPAESPLPPCPGHCQGRHAGAHAKGQQTSARVGQVARMNGHDQGLSTRTGCPIRHPVIASTTPGK